MQTLTINALSLESARGFLDGLTGFDAELLATDDAEYSVQVTLGGGARELVAVLNALELYVTGRDEGPAEVGVSGRIYELHPVA